MKKAININGTKFSLRNIEQGKRIIDLVPYKKNRGFMKYQFVCHFDGQINNDKFKFLETTTYGMSETLCLGTSGTWAILNDKNFHSGETYDKEDLRIIYGFIMATYKNCHLDTCEDLCLATQDENIISLFYKSYGDLKSSGLSDFLLGTAWNDDYVPKTVQKGTILSKIYGSRRYSVYRLIQDLVNDKAQVLMDKSLVQKYLRISPKKTDSNIKKSNTDQWWNVISFSGNRERANLSLTVESKVTVEVPENNHGVKPGNRVLSSVASICLIKDGVHHTPEIGVKVSKTLAQKLRSTGCVEMNLIHSGEYLLDLRHLPVISKTDIRQITSKDMATITFNWMLEKVKMNYFERLLHKSEYDKNTGKKIEKPLSEQESYLRSLGIYGNKYVPDMKEDLEGYSYNTVNLVTKVSGFPGSSETLAKCLNTASGIIYGYNPKTGSDSNKLINYLKKIDIKTEPIQNLYNQSAEKWKNLNKLLRDYTFCLIMSKTVRFKDYLKPDVVEVEAKASDSIYGDVEVKWMFKDKTVNV